MRTLFLIMMMVMMGHAATRFQLQDELRPDDLELKEGGYVDYFQLDVDSGEVMIEIASTEMDVCLIAFSTIDSTRYKVCVDPGYGPLQHTLQIEQAQTITIGVSALFADQFGAYRMVVSGDIAGEPIPFDPREAADSPAAAAHFFHTDMDSVFKTQFELDPGCYFVDVVSPHFQPQLELETPDGGTFTGVTIRQGFSQAIIKTEKAGPAELTITSDAGGTFTMRVMPVTAYQPPLQAWFEPSPASP